MKEMNDDRVDDLTIYNIESEYVMDYGKLSTIVKDNVMNLLNKEVEIGKNSMMSMEVKGNEIVTFFIPLNEVKVFNLNKDDIQPTFQNVGVKLSITIV